MWWIGSILWDCFKFHNVFRDGCEMVGHGEESQLIIYQIYKSLQNTISSQPDEL